MVSSEESHASVKTYVVLAVVLCVITFIEWVIFKVDTLKTNANFMIPVLSILSLAKFTMVCGWYMHLKYDHKILTKIYVFSGLLSVMIFTILMLALR